MHHFLAEAEQMAMLALTASLLTDLESKVGFSFARPGRTELQEAALMDFVRPLAAQATQDFGERLQIDN